MLIVPRTTGCGDYEYVVQRMTLNVLKNHEKRIKARTTREREDKVFLNFLIALVLICLVAGLIDWVRTQARFSAHSPLLVGELPTIVRAQPDRHYWPKDIRLSNAAAMWRGAPSFTITDLRQVL